MMRWLRAVGFCVALLLSGHAVAAVDLNSNQFAVFKATTPVYNFTLTIYYVVPKRNLVLLHGDIATPISFMPALMGYSFLLDDSGNPVNLQEVPYNAENVMELSSSITTVEPSDYKLFSGDFNGDGAADLLLQGAGGRSSIVLTAGSSGPSFLHNFRNTLASTSNTCTRTYWAR